METILGYLRQLIVVIFFATLVEWLLPSNQYRRYVKLVTGLLIILAVLAPLKELLEEGITLASWGSAQAGSVSFDDTIILEHERKVKEAYEERLAVGIARDISQMLGISGVVVSVETEAVGDFSGPPEIVRVGVDLSSASKDGPRLVEPVAINLDDNQDQDEGFRAEIATVIAQLYQIERDRIVFTTGG